MKRLLTYIITIIFVFSIAPLSLAQGIEVPQPNTIEEQEVIRYVPPKLPKGVEPYNPDDPLDLKPNQLYSKSAILIEANTGKVLFEKNADDIMFPASTTKIMTVLLGAENGNPEQEITITEQDMAIQEGSSTIPLQVGETINFKDLLYATMLRSGNEGANAIAATVGGTIESFVEKMNMAAQNMGLSHTHFANPHGLHDPNHYTTARDMAKIAQVAMKNTLFRNIVGTAKYTLPKSNLSRKKNLSSRISDFIVQKENNPYYYPYGNGIKTGFTNAAGHCFVASAESLGVNLISVVFYSTEEGRWTDTKKLMDYGFAQIVSETPVGIYAIDPIIIETSGYSTKDDNLGKLQLDLLPESGSTSMSLIFTRDKFEDFAREMLRNSSITYTRNFRAPITKGETMGRLTYVSPQTNESATYTLVASRDILAREDAPLSLSQIEQNVFKDTNIFPDLTLELLFYWSLPPIVLYAIITLIIKIKKQRDLKQPTHYTRRRKRY